MDFVNRKITYKLYPNKAQAAKLEELAGLHCRVYNTLLETHKTNYEAGLPAYSGYMEIID